MARFKQTFYRPSTNESSSAEVDNSSNIHTTVTQNHEEPTQNESIVTSAINSIDLCNSLDKNKTDNEEKVYYDILEHPE